MSGGGSFRVSFVSLETALCVGPRNVVQSCVVAPAGTGFGVGHHSRLRLRNAGEQRLRDERLQQDASRDAKPDTTS